MIFAPLLLVGAMCNAIYCVVKIRADLKAGQAAFGIVGIFGLLAATALSLIAITALLLTSDGELT